VAEVDDLTFAIVCPWCGEISELGDAFVITEYHGMAVPMHTSCEEERLVKGTEGKG
jgi:hypothetical protein